MNAGILGCAVENVSYLDTYNESRLFVLAKPALGAWGTHGRLAGHSPEPRRSTSDSGSEVLRRGSGEAPAGLWREERAITRRQPDPKAVARSPAADTIRAVSSCPSSRAGLLGVGSFAFPAPLPHDRIASAWQFQLN